MWSSGQLLASLHHRHFPQLSRHRHAGFRFRVPRNKEEPERCGRRLTPLQARAPADQRESTWEEPATQDTGKASEQNGAASVKQNGRGKTDSKPARRGRLTASGFVSSTKQASDAPRTEQFGPGVSEYQARQPQQFIGAGARVQQAGKPLEAPSDADYQSPSETSDDDDEQDQSEDEDDAEELWDEVGEELPADLDDVPSKAPRRGGPVPAGDYFTVVKGPSKGKVMPPGPGPPQPRSTDSADLLKATASEPSNAPKVAMASSSSSDKGSSSRSDEGSSSRGDMSPTPSSSATHLAGVTDSTGIASSPQEKQPSPNAAASSSVASGFVPEQRPSAAETAPPDWRRERLEAADLVPPHSVQHAHASASQPDPQQQVPKASPLHGASEQPGLASTSGRDFSQQSGHLSQGLSQRTGGQAGHDGAQHSAQRLTEQAIGSLEPKRGPRQPGNSAKLSRLKQKVGLGARQDAQGDLDQPQTGEVQLKFGSDFFQHAAQGEWQSEGVAINKLPELILPKNWEQNSREPGYISQIFVDCEFLTADLQRHEDCPQQYLSWRINRCMLVATVWQTPLHVARDLGMHFDKINVSTAMHRPVKLMRHARVPFVKFPQHSLYSLLIERLQQLMMDLDVRQMCNIMGAMAWYGDHDMQVLEPLCQRFAQLDVRELHDIELSNSAWAHGKLRLRFNGNFLQRCANECTSRLQAGQMVPEQCVSNLTWAMGRLGMVNEDFCRAVGQYAVLWMASWPTQATGNISYGLALMGFRHDGFLQAVAEYMSELLPQTDTQSERRQMENFKSQELSNVMIAFSRLSFYHEPFLQALEADLIRPKRLGQLSRQALINLLHSFATLHFYPQRFLEAASAELVRHLQEDKHVTDQELAIGLYSFAKLAHHPGDEMLNAACICMDNLMESGNRLSNQACCNFLWALAVLTGCNPTVVRAIQWCVFHPEDNLSRSQDAVSQLHQMVQALLLARLEANANDDKQLTQALIIPKDVEDQAIRLWKQFTKKTHLSSLHGSVSQVLKVMGVAHENEHLTDSGLFSVDIALLEAGAGQRVCLEVDGPYHFANNCHQPLGHTILRRKLMTALGWTIVCVPYYDWTPLDNLADRVAYLAKVMARCGVAPPANAPPLASPNPLTPDPSSAPGPLGQVAPAPNSPRASPASAALAAAQAAALAVRSAAPAAAAAQEPADADTPKISAQGQLSESSSELDSAAAAAEAVEPAGTLHAEPSGGALADDDPSTTAGGLREAAAVEQTTSAAAAAPGLAFNFTSLANAARRAVEGAQAAHQQRQREHITPLYSQTGQSLANTSSHATQLSSTGLWPQHSSYPAVSTTAREAAGRAHQLRHQAPGDSVAAPAGNQLAGNGSQFMPSLPLQSQEVEGQGQGQGQVARQVSARVAGPSTRTLRVPHMQQAQVVAQDLLRQRQPPAAPAEPALVQTSSNDQSTWHAEPALVQMSSSDQSTWHAQPAGGRLAGIDEAQLHRKPNARHQAPADGQRVSRKKIKTLRQLKDASMAVKPNALREANKGTELSQLYVPLVPRRRSKGEAAQEGNRQKPAAAKSPHLASFPNEVKGKAGHDGETWKTAAAPEAIDGRGSSNQVVTQDGRQQKQAGAKRLDFSVPKAVKTKAVNGKGALLQAIRAADGIKGAASLESTLDTILQSARQKPNLDEQDFEAHTLAELKSMRVVNELRPLCQKYGLISSGQKDLLILRILAHEAGLCMSMGL